MQTLETINVSGGRRVELQQGDLSNLARHEWFDAIVVSAFAGDYTPTATSLVGALHRRGVSVRSLADEKDLDYGQLYATWLSGAVRAADPAIGFGRVICFEPELIGTPPQVVGHLFRALVGVVAERPDIRSLAMPILATGHQGYSLAEMLPPMLEASARSLAGGLPLDRIAIVVNDELKATEARKYFVAAQQSSGEYDVFVSYAHEDTRARELFVAALHEVLPSARVFVDRFEIDPGAAWQRRIFEGLDRCRCVVSLLTPAYLASEPCLEEFNIAWMRSRERREDLLRPLFVSESELPTYMRSRLYVDCREFDSGKLTAAAASVAQALR